MTDYTVIQEKPLPKNRNILKDEIIRLNGYYASKECPCLLRRIEVWDEENEKIIALLTNHQTFGSTTISAIYKDRWQIEISEVPFYIQLVFKQPYCDAKV